MTAAELPQQFVKPLAVCATALTLDDGLAWELLECFASDRDTRFPRPGGEWLAWVKHSGFVEYCSPTEWRIIPGLREGLLRRLDRNLERQIHRFLSKKLD